MTQDIIDKRWRKINLIAWYLQLTPFIRFIAITGSMAFNLAKDESDINIFIIARAKRIWTCFYFSRLLLKLMWQLRTSEKKAGKICPNHYVTDEYLIINPQNAYFAQQYSHLIPIFDEKHLCTKFFTANKWMEELGYSRPVCALNLVQSNTLNFLRHVLEICLAGGLGNWLEHLLKKSQLKRILREEPTCNQPGSSIVANDNEIRIQPREQKS